MSSSRNLTMQDLLNVLNNANNNDKQNNNLQTHASSTETHDLSFYNLSPEHITNFVMSLFKLIQETMRDCILEKGVTFDLYYRQFKKKAPDFPPTRADWTIKELLIIIFNVLKRDNKNAKVVDGNRNSNEENNENHDSEIGETNNSERQRRT
ncbi:unnamed protein product [Rhizophagus irregularis]|nr:unnamed protein product [Rhizophagus irregularis]